MRKKHPHAHTDPEKPPTSEIINNVPLICPSCGASYISYKIDAGDIQTESTLPTVRYAAPQEIDIFIQAVNNARSKKQKEMKTCKKIEEALAILQTHSDHLSDDEYNLLLIFVFFIAHSAKPETWLEPVLGISRFRPSPVNRGRAACPERDVIRAYENMIQIFCSMVKGPSEIPNAGSSDAYRLTTQMRKPSEIASEREGRRGKSASQKKALLKTINNISIGTISETPSRDYLGVVREFLDLTAHKNNTDEKIPTA